MRIGKHSKTSQEIRKLKETIELQEEKIRKIKSENAKNFESIMELCFINDYNNRSAKLRKIYESASNSHFNLLEDLTFADRKIELLPPTKVNK